MSPTRLDPDNFSVFTYDEAEPNFFNLTKLNEAVNTYFKKSCLLVKLNEGGFHKVYDDIGKLDSKSLGAVVRVASPAFPKDKMLSEIATLKYIAAFTTVPVPQVFTWNVDATNPVGAECMIMEKIRGISPYGDKWESLPLPIKLNVVKQVAKHLAILFSLRFQQIGSLYFAVDGVPEYPGISQATFKSLTKMRGPFDSSSGYLASFLRTKLFKIDNFREAVRESITSNDVVASIENARKVINLGLELCRYYPGDRPIPWPLHDPERPFSLMLGDFRLTNILIDEETGDITGYIDFERTIVAPLWPCATVPQWIPNPRGGMAKWYGGTPEEQEQIWATFYTAMSSTTGTSQGASGGKLMS
ncbi:phosphotransferase enzyme family protein [Ceratobasidium sp. AG-Ba]|nr:phosphotransferase enzyme family protein [Ceratobasidium sp. AG-Ba]